MSDSASAGVRTGVEGADGVAHGWLAVPEGGIIGDEGEGRQTHGRRRAVRCCLTVCFPGRLSGDGGEYVAGVLKSGAPEADIITQLRAVGIQRCTIVHLVSECGGAVCLYDLMAGLTCEVHGTDMDLTGQEVRVLATALNGSTELKVLDLGCTIT